MTKYQPDWIFNLALQFAVAICLSTLVLALAMDVAPLTALWRSGLILIVFGLLGWTISLIWQAPEPSKVPVEDNPDTTENSQPTTES
jgi:hypothetical protein